MFLLLIRNVGFSFCIPPLAVHIVVKATHRACRKWTRTVKNTCQNHDLYSEYCHILHKSGIWSQFWLATLYYCVELYDINYQVNHHNSKEKSCIRRNTADLGIEAVDFWVGTEGKGRMLRYFGICVISESMLLINNPYLI